MAYGKIKSDALIYDNGGTDVEITISTLPTAADIGTTIQAYDADTAKTDTAQTFTAAQRGALRYESSVSGNTALDFSLANNFELALTGNATFDNPTNMVAGQSGSLFLVQDATGSRTAAWGAYWKFPGGTAPTLSTAANSQDRVDYIVRHTSVIHCVFTGNYS